MAGAAAVLPVEARHDAMPRSVDDRDRAFIEYLRVTALDCRASARTDLFRACALLAVEKPKAREAHAQVLMKTLSEILETKPRLYRPGVTELSFDETWLISLARAVRAEDGASAAFLLRSRVPQHARRKMLFLMSMIAEQ